MPFAYMDSMQGGYLPDSYSGPYDSREEATAAAMEELQALSDNSEAAIFAPAELCEMREALERESVLRYSHDSFIGRDRILEVYEVDQEQALEMLEGDYY